MTRISKWILLSVIPLIILASSIAMASNDSLTALVPESALVTLEFKNLQKRWGELQSIPGMRTFHERVLGTVGMHPDDIPILAGDSAVVALLPGENGHSMMPLVLIRPADMDEAESLLPAKLTVHHGDNALWISFGDTADQLRELAEADGPSQSWNPKGHELIHGTIDPEAMATFLRSAPEGIDPPPLAIARSMYAGMLDDVRSIEFTRDVRAGSIIADGRIEMTHDFNTAPDSPPILPSPLPRHMILASSFRTEPEASLAWFNKIADSDPRGPLRNFGFWMSEFEERTGHNLQQNLVDALGERGWFFLLEGDQFHTMNAVGIFEAQDPDLLDDTLSDLLHWIGDQTQGKSLGLISPRVHGNSLTFRTPFGELPGPAFELRNGYLLVGTSPEALAEGEKLLRTRNSWQPTVPAMPRSAQFANESVRINGQALTRWLDWEPHLDSIALDIWYGEDAIQISGQARFQ
jgi:hypothetical protein